jgi:hypothetical protein
MPGTLFQTTLLFSNAVFSVSSHDCIFSFQTSDLNSEFNNDPQ